MNAQVKSFLKISSLLVLVFTILVFSIVYSLIYLSSRYYLEVSTVGVALFAAFLFLSSFSTIIIINAYRKKHINPTFGSYTKEFLNLIYPLLHVASRISKTDKEQIRLFYIEMNNIIINSKSHRVDPSKVLMLTPHCLQDSSCEIKITTNPKNCKRCGKCNVKDLIELSEKYGLAFYVASGGTFARKIVSEAKPEFIVTVACERDLLSGIQDVKSIPVIGIVNERPNGPCFNTKVDIKNVEEAIRNIIG